MTGELTKGCFDVKYKGWDTARVFHDLKENPPPQDDSLDSHDWDGAKDMTPDEKDALA